MAESTRMGCCGVHMVKTQARRSGRAKVQGRMTRDAAGIIGSVDEGIVALLGWRPDQMVGLPSTNFIHPDDQASAVAAWMDMLTTPGSSRAWRGRYRTVEGDWKWVEAVNTNQLADPDDPLVVSVMAEVPEREWTLEDELRERNQVLSRLGEVLPVGLFQIDTRGQIVSTNGRLHDIIGVPPSSTLKKQLATIVPADRRLFDAAVAEALHGGDIDDLEIRLQVPSSPDRDELACSVNLRALTDQHGKVTGCIGCVSDVTERAALRHDLENRATMDELTQCLNRSATIEVLRDVLADRRRRGAGVAVAFLDLDGFKDVNDSRGHGVGDEILALTADRLRSAIRRFDRVGRIGGDEFLVICPDVASPSLALVIATRLCRAVCGPARVGGLDLPVSASLGIAWSADGRDADTLIARADVAMYEAKVKGHPVVWQARGRPRARSGGLSAAHGPAHDGRGARGAGHTP